MPLLLLSGMTTAASAAHAHFPLLLTGGLLSSPAPVEDESAGSAHQSPGSRSNRNAAAQL